MLLAAESTLLLESIIKLARIFLVRHTYAKFTLHYFSPIFHSPTGFDESPQMPEIWGKSVLVHASDNHVVWIFKDAIWENRRWVADTWEIFGMLNIWSCWRFTILLCEWVLTENYIGDDLQLTWPTWESKKQGSWKLGEDFFYCKAIYKKRAYILP